MEVVLENFNPKTSTDCPGGDWLGQRSGAQKVPPLPPQVPGAEVRAAGPPVGGASPAQGPDDECLFAMCMFCIFSRFAALAAGAAGKKACLLRAAHLLTVMNDSLLPASSPPLCPGGPGSSEVFTNGWKRRQTGFVRPHSRQSKEVPSQLAPCWWSTHLCVLLGAVSLSLLK